MPLEVPHDLVNVIAALCLFCWIVGLGIGIVIGLAAAAGKEKHPPAS